MVMSSTSALMYTVIGSSLCVIASFYWASYHKVLFPPITTAVIVQYMIIQCLTTIIGSSLSLMFNLLLSLSLAKVLFPAIINSDLFPKMFQRGRIWCRSIGLEGCWVQWDILEGRDIKANGCYFAIKVTDSCRLSVLHYYWPVASNLAV